MVISIPQRSDHIILCIVKVDGLIFCHLLHKRCVFPISSCVAHIPFLVVAVIVKLIIVYIVKCC